MADTEEQKTGKNLEEDQEAAAVTSHKFTGQLKKSLENDLNAKAAIRKCVIRWGTPWICLFCFFIGFFLCYFILVNYDISLEKTLINMAEKRGVEIISK